MHKSAFVGLCIFYDKHKGHLFKIKYAQNADIITLCCKGYVPQDLIRTSHYDWQLEPLDIQPDISMPLNPSCSWHGGKESSRQNKHLV